MSDRGRGKRPIKSVLMVAGIVTVSALLWTGCIRGGLFIADQVNLVSASCEDLTGVAQIRCINQRVNREIRPMTDERQYGEDRWVVSPRAGDCEDYALTKAERLRVAGVSDNRMHVAAYLRESVTAGRISYAPHAVLVVDEMALDNLSDRLEAPPEGAVNISMSRARAMVGKGQSMPLSDMIDASAGHAGAVW